MKRKKGLGLNKFKSATLVVLTALVIINAKTLSVLGKEILTETEKGRILSKTIEYVLTGGSPLNKLENGTYKPIKNNDVTVSFIDVDQGDSILIEDQGKTMLIDTGVEKYYPTVQRYLRERGVNNIDILILSHPDSDHIGSAVNIIQEYDVPVVYSPDVTGNNQAYKKLKKIIRERGIEEIHPKGEETIHFGSAKYTIYGSKKKWEDINSYSLIVKVVNENDSFLFTGDATGEEIEELESYGYDFSSTVLKAAHHGSANCGCNNKQFIKSVNPQAIVISCGYQNSYGNPHKETMDLAKSMNLDVYRTDLQGSILALSTGNGITFDKDWADDYSCGRDLIHEVE